MKRLLFVYSLLCCISIPALSRDLHKGELLVKSIMELEFNEQAIEADAYIVWELSGDWDKFEYSFTQGTCKNGQLTLKASEYQDFCNGQYGIAISLQGKSKTKGGNYSLFMKVLEVSEELEFSKEELNCDMKITYILPPPEPIWKKLLVPGIIVVVLILILLLVLHITAKFPTCTMQLNREEISLGGKKSVSVKEELMKLGIELEEGTDVVLVKNRFGAFNGPVIKKTENCLLECAGELMSKGNVILLDEEVRGLKDIDGNEIIIRCC